MTQGTNLSKNIYKEMQSNLQTNTCSPEQGHKTNTAECIPKANGGFVIGVSAPEDFIG